MPPEFAQVVHRLLAKDPDQRYANAEVVAEELRRFGGTVVLMPVEMTGDAVYQEAVRVAVEAIPVAELASNSVDAMLFKVEPEPAPAYQLDSETVQRSLLWVAVGLGLFWLFASVVVIVAILIRSLMALVG